MSFPITVDMTVSDTACRFDVAVEESSQAIDAELDVRIEPPYPFYDGQTSVTVVSSPLNRTIVLETAGKIVTENITISVSNSINPVNPK